MKRKIKLLWDFHGGAAEMTAKHHQKHLDEFSKRENIPCELSGVEQFSAAGFSAFMVVPENYMLTVRDALKPKRAVVFDGSDQKNNPTPD